jgi:hypothetical protein
MHPLHQGGNMANFWLGAIVPGIAATETMMSYGGGLDRALAAAPREQT